MQVFELANIGLLLCPTKWLFEPDRSEKRKETIVVILPFAGVGTLVLVSNWPAANFIDGKVSTPFSS